MHIFCTSAEAIVLLAGEQGDGPLRFYSEGGALPGVSLTVQQRVPIHEQIVSQVKSIFGHVTAQHIDIDQRFVELIKASPEREVSLYIGRIKGIDPNTVNKWSTMPELLRSMGRDRSRIAYTKAWQVYCGVLSENVSVIETDNLEKYIGFKPEQ